MYVNGGNKKEPLERYREHHVAVAALLLQLMAKQTKRLHSHHGSVLGDKGNALRMVCKGMCTGHKEVPVDRWTMVRRACVRATE